MKRCLLLSLLLLSACTQLNFNQTLQQTNQRTAEFSLGQLALQRTELNSEQKKQLEDFLQRPLEQADAVRLALLNSPALQTLLAQTWAEQAQTVQQSRIGNPSFSFERLHSADELEIGRLLTFGLFDLLTLPQRSNIAEQQLDQQQLQLSSNVIELVTQVRQAWVHAVAAQQTLLYTKQVLELAEASAELAQRLEKVGNFSKLQHAQQRSFYLEAVNQTTLAQHQAQSRREELVRMLGLNDTQAQQLQLPARLPDLPNTPRAASQVGVSSTRLDIQLAQAQYRAASRAQGLTALSSVIDIELGMRRDSGAVPKRGYETTLRLPFFDWGEAKREMMNARTLAAANHLEATVRAAGSQLRESYSAYRSAYDIAKQYRDEILPLRKNIADENLLRYNGMLIGVFELLVSSREQINSVIAAIASQQQYWNSYAALQASLIGKPSNILISNNSTTKTNEAGH